MARLIRRCASSPGKVLRALAPFGDFDRVREQTGRFLERAAPPGSGGAWLPASEEDERDGSFILKLELPGYPADSIDIEVEDGTLIIRGDLPEENRAKVLSRRQGRFVFRAGLPAGADPERCQATLDNGVLTVTVPKPARQRRRRIEIGQGPAAPRDGTRSGVPREKNDGMSPVEAHNTFVAGATAQQASERHTPQA
ncbi:Hsp20/alpha crystallin family protein [Streptomyces sp. BR123]|uniref:Hsp20/alpha crystallin family protein n=1 Tax=Streptomyces sp. BR123 TaxID=2749828 RepID=UPI0015C40E2B|nr:Hsp20/alpha crystallin family protein [Streptomyces sp. BR123]NXY99364.1 Hsp20/alpha crystallin family protein [Streptomyces sp. BR123]